MAANFGGGQWNINQRQVRVLHHEAYMIEDGKITYR